jgi:hypothetical protein
MALTLQAALSRKPFSPGVFLPPSYRPLSEWGKGLFVAPDNSRLPFLRQDDQKVGPPELHSPWLPVLHPGSAWNLCIPHDWVGLNIDNKC